jgi:hypothetical protein
MADDFEITRFSLLLHTFLTLLWSDKIFQSGARAFPHLCVLAAQQIYCRGLNGANNGVDDVLL